jgi:hypothetical protein
MVLWLVLTATRILADETRFAGPGAQRPARRVRAEWQIFHAAKATLATVSVPNGALAA